VRSTVPVLPTARDRLLSIAELVDLAGPEHPDGIIVSVALEEDDVVLGVRRLDPTLHPTIELAGLVAEPSWWALCLCTHGRARFLDEPDRLPEAIVSTFAVDRCGTEVSLLRRGATVTELPGPALGRIPELLRSILGSPPPS
jgi:hypothetical protein